MAHMNKRTRSSVSGRTRALEDELSGKQLNNASKYSIDAGRDVQTDLTGWQRQALANAQGFAIKQGFRRHHPNRSLATFKNQIQGQNPRESWEKAMEDETERVQIPSTYKKARNDMAV